MLVLIHVVTLFQLYQESYERLLKVKELFSKVKKTKDIVYKDLSSVYELPTSSPGVKVERLKAGKNLKTSICTKETV